MFIYYLHMLLKIFLQNQFQPLFTFYKYTFSFSLTKGDIYIYIGGQKSFTKIGFQGQPL